MATLTKTESAILAYLQEAPAGEYVPVERLAVACGHVVVFAGTSAIGGPRWLRGPKNRRVRNMAEINFDVCECGDYRKDHHGRGGSCVMPNDMSHGFKPCNSFRLHIPATEIPAVFREAQ